MLHILLLILKIIGIILGVLLGIILLMLCIVLFVPVRYQIEAERTEGEGNPPVEARVKITWLLHLLGVKLIYPSEVYLKARILFFTVFKLPSGEAKKDSSSKQRKKSKEKNPGDHKPDESPSQTEEEIAERNFEKKEGSEEKKSESRELIEEKRDTQAEKQENDEQEAEAEETENNDKEKQKLSLKKIIIKIQVFFQNIWYTIRKICDRIKGLLENIEYYLGVIQSDTFQKAYALCKDELGSIWAYVKPRKLVVDLTVGMGDPAATGQVLACYGILYPFIGDHVTVIGDFDQKKIEGSVFIKGKIRLFTFLKAAVRIYFNKNIKELIKLFKKEGV